MPDPGNLAIRLQTHNGDGVPIGLWQDTDCTIPATEDFDPIAAWSDELGNSGIVFVQSNAAKQPFLLFDENGIPTVSFDGVDDFLLLSSLSVAQPFTIYAGFRNNDVGSGSAHDVIISSTADVGIYEQTGTPAFLYLYAGGVVGLNTAVGTATLTSSAFVFNGTSSQLYLDGSLAASGTGGSTTPHNLSIGASPTGGRPTTIDIYAMFLDTATYDSDISDYVQSLQAVEEPPDPGGGGVMMYESTAPSSGDEIGDLAKKFNQATYEFFNQGLEGEYLTPDESQYYVTPDGSQYYQQPS